MQVDSLMDRDHVLHCLLNVLQLLTPGIAAHISLLSAATLQRWICDEPCLLLKLLLKDPLGHYCQTSRWWCDVISLPPKQVKISRRRTILWGPFC